MDAGIYRCGVRIFPSTFEDVEVTVSDLSGVNTTLLSAKSTVKPAVWMPSSPSTAIVSENDAEKLGWRTSFMLGAVLSLVVFAAVSVTLVFLHKTEKKKSTDKYRTCSSLDTILEVTYVLQNNPTDGQILEYLKSRHNEITEWNCFVNSRGQVDPLYEGRIYIRNYIGEFEVRITDLTVRDAGKYRCGVRIFPSTFEDVEVTVSDIKDLNGVNTTPLSAKSTNKPAVWWSSSPSTAIVSENDAQKLSDDWRTSYTLAAVLTVLVFAVISMTLLVCRLKTKKKKSTEKSGTCDSANTTLEQNGIIYSMVDFTPHQDPSELYANLQIHSPENTDTSSRCIFTTEESVEYSTILRAPV